MGKPKLAATIMLKMPERVSWAIQAQDQSWTGKDLMGFLSCISRQVDRPITLSVSLLFELTENSGTALK